MKHALVLFIVFISILATSQQTPVRPLLGAQIWLEPGQTSQQIDAWFKTLADEHMPVARLFLMWNYMEVAPGQWDFSLYDAAFRAAEKYHVRIVGTLTAQHGPPFRGWPYASQGAGIVDTPEHLDAARIYIQKVVRRYKDSGALDTWMLMNEPGEPPNGNPLAVIDFRAWLQKEYGTIEKLNAAWLTAYSDFAHIEYDSRWSGGGFTWPTSFVDWYTFWREHMTGHLAWVAQQIRAVDPRHPLHVNPHALVRNLADNAYELPAWRAFLDSLGASIHPAWHFGLLQRDQYALGVSYICDLVHGASEPHPFWVTELQGGNNLYSALRPMNPTPDDIAQWVWISVGAGSDRVLFWLLNARDQGGEAAEWSMLDLQGRPSERLETAGRIARILEANADFFATAKPEQSSIAIILSPETMTLQERYHSDDYPGRSRDAHIMAVLAMYKALAEMGVSARIKWIDDFDWSVRAGTGAILPHLSAITEAQAQKVQQFVEDGNAALITGLTGFYNPAGKAWSLTRFPLEHTVGGRLKEVRLIGKEFALPLQQWNQALPAHMWEGEIESTSGAETLGKDGERIVGLQNRIGRSGDVLGRAVWIPSMIDLGAWLGDDSELTSLLAKTFEDKKSTFTFPERSPGCLMRVLRNGDRFVTVLTNGRSEENTCRVQTSRQSFQVLWGEAPHQEHNRYIFDLEPRGTNVLMWR